MEPVQYIQSDGPLKAGPACYFPPGLFVSCHKLLQWPEPLCWGLCSTRPGSAHTPVCRRSPALAWQWRPAQQPCAQTRCGGAQGCSDRPRDTAPTDSWTGRTSASPPASPERASAKAGHDAGAEESGIQSPSGGGSSPRLGPAPPWSWSALSDKRRCPVRSRFSQSLLSLYAGPLLLRGCFLPARPAGGWWRSYFLFLLISAPPLDPGHP